MCAYNETLVYGKNKVEHDSYISFTKNRKVGTGGGISTLVREEIKDYVVGAGEGQGEDEYLVTRLECYSPPLSVVNCYGEQDKVGPEEQLARWGRLRKELETIRARGELCLLAGDMNKHVGCDDLGVPGNKPEVDRGGHMVRALLATGDWLLVNAMGEEVVEGGPFTREDPATGALSCLQLFIVSRELRPFVTKLVIDSALELTVGRSVSEKGKYRLVRSDHFPCILTMENLPWVGRKKGKEDKQVKWNLAKIGGWNRYKVLSDECSEALEEALEEKNKTVEEKAKIFEQIHKKVLFRSFGKVTIGVRSGVKNNEKEKETDVKSEEEKATELYEEQKERAEKELSEIRMKEGKVGMIYEAARRIRGGKRNAMEPTAIMNPETGELAVTREGIKSVTLRYCVATLKNNIPEPGFEFGAHIKDQLHTHRMKLNDGEFGVRPETFEKVVKKFKMSNKRSYDFLTKAGQKFQQVCLKFCKIMFCEEVFPSSFRDTVLHMVFKAGKMSRREVLPDNRFIHSKQTFLPRLAESLLVEQGVKQPLLRNSTRYQIGGQPGHRPEELLFCMKSVVAKQMLEGKLTVGQAHDVSKYFDKEVQSDTIDMMRRREVDPKVCRLWAGLNDTRVKARTGVGDTAWAEVGPCIGQGTIGGALASQGSLDDGAEAQFSGSQDEIGYGAVEMGPFLFQDDFYHNSGSILQARQTNIKVNILIKEKRLSLNSSKSVAILFGTSKQKQDAKQELEEKPLMCGDVRMILAQTEKWLGDYLHTGGLAASVLETISQREGKVKGAALEIAAIVDDWRSEAVGGFETGLFLWESCCLPSLLHNAGTWVEMSTDAVKRLNSLQNWFVRLLLRQGPGSPTGSLLWETGLLSMDLLVWREKLSMILHIRGLDQDSLAKRIWAEQMAFNWPGLAKEAAKICIKLKM